MNRPRISRLALLAALSVLAGSLCAQTYPSGPIRIVVPYPPGGGTDILTRQIAQRLSESWSVPVIVDNRGGASGTIGTALVAKAPADGQTLLVVPSGFAVNPSIYKNLPYDSVRDLAPVSQLAASPLILCVHPSFPPQSVKELVAFLKARPGQIDFGSSGNGSPSLRKMAAISRIGPFPCSHHAFRLYVPLPSKVSAGSAIRRS